MAGIVSALVAHHHVGALAQPIDDLAFALVAPLAADDNHICHEELPFAWSACAAHSVTWAKPLAQGDGVCGRPINEPGANDKSLVLHPDRCVHSAFNAPSLDAAPQQSLPSRRPTKWTSVSLLKTRSRCSAR